MATLTYSHPHILTNIFDNSQVNKEATTAVEIPALFQPYFGERGPSGKVVEYNSAAEFVKIAGNPNFKKYGQSGYNILNWLRNGGKVYALRLTAPDSTYANVGLNVRTKAVETTNEAGEVVKSVDIKLESIKLPNLMNISDEHILNEITNLAPADDGYTDHVLFVSYAEGTGAYGNNIAFRLTSEVTYNKTYDFKCYAVSIIESDNSGSNKVLTGPAVISFYPEALTNGGSSLSLPMVFQSYFDGVSCFYNDEAYDQLIDDIMTATDNVYDIPENIDFIFGDEHCTVDRTGAASMFSAAGIFFEDGSNGSVSDRFTEKETKKVYDKLLQGVFSGSDYPEIFDKKQYPIDVILDANFDLTIKNSINDFVNQRGDCIAVLDTGECQSPEETIVWRQNNIVYEDYFTSLWSQALKLYDTFTASDIVVTPTYFLASKIPSTDSQYGIHYPFVGPNRGVITGYKSLNWTPNEQQKENLYDNDINYIEKNYRNTRFMGQLTTLNRKTALSDINHVRCLLKITREVEEIMDNYIFELANADTFASINAELASALAEWVTKGACTVCQGTCTQTALEAENKTAHVTVEIVFVDVIEKIIIDINVNR